MEVDVLFTPGLAQSQDTLLWWDVAVYCFPDLCVPGTTFLHPETANWMLVEGRTEAGRFIDLGLCSFQWVQMQ